MSDSSQGDGWWIASDGKWYPPELHPDRVAAVPSEPEPAPDRAGPVEPNPPVPPDSPPPDLPSGPGSASATVTFPAVPPPSTPPAAPPFAPSESSSSNRSRTIVLAIAAVVLVAGLVFLGLRLFGGSSGGAASPEAAVEQLLTSIAEGDEVGIAELFDPDEIEGWVGSFGPASEIAAESGQDQTAAARQFDDFIESLFEAIDVQLTGPDGGEFVFGVTDLDRDGRIARVRIEGLDLRLEATASPDETLIIGPPDDVIGLDLGRLDGAGLEVRDEPGGLRVRAFAPGEQDVDDFADGVHLDVVTVEKDGRWYLSIGYTVLENVWNAPGVDFARPDYGRAYRLVDDRSGGADTPEDAVREFVFAIETLDYGRMIRLSDPLSLPYLHDFQPAIDREVDPRDVRDAARELDLRVSTLELSTGDWNGRRLVTIDALGGRIADGTFDVDTRIWCIDAVSPDGDRVVGCLEDAIAEFLDETGQFDADPRDLVPGAPALVVVERNGRWFLDPLGTFGYYVEQAADALTELDLDQTLSEGAGIDGVTGFIAQSGPVVGDGDVATATPTEGLAAVAVDLRGLAQPTIESFDPTNLGLVRVTSSGPSRFVGLEARPAASDEWVVVYQRGELGTGNPIHPAIVLETDDELTVSVQPVTVTTVGVDGVSGTIDEDGRPQVLVFEGLDGDVEFDGSATYETVSRWDDLGVVVRNGVFSSNAGDPSFGSFTVVTGDPGDTFDLRYRPFVPEPDPEPEPEREPEPEPGPAAGFGDERVDRFAELVTVNGYEIFAFEQQGGYFDGCGPEDPDVTSYAFEADDGELVLITPYPSESRAIAAFEALTELASPCDAFPGLVIDEVDVEPGLDAVTITYSSEDDPTPFFEYYARRDDVIVVATGSTFERLLAGSEAVSTFG